jgi:hypothetical protein
MGRALASGGILPRQQQTRSHGFQASCADLDFLRRTRSMDGPFIILKAEDMLYPQYDLPEKLREAMESWKEWAAEECAKKLEKSGEEAHPKVKAHWERLASHKSNAPTLARAGKDSAITDPLPTARCQQ